MHKVSLRENEHLNKYIRHCGCSQTLHFENSDLFVKRVVCYAYQSYIAYPRAL